MVGQTQTNELLPRFDSFQHSFSASEAPFLFCSLPLVCLFPLADRCFILPLLPLSSTLLPFYPSSSSFISYFLIIKMPSNEGLTPTSPVFRVLIVGGSYGGLSAALTLVDLTRGKLARFNFNPEAKACGSQIPIQITVVDERDGYYHLIGSPKALACDKFAPVAWTRFGDIPALKSPNLRFVQGSISSIDPAQKVAQILDVQTKENREEKYDYLIASSGLRRVFPTVPQSLNRDEYLMEAKKHMENVQNAREGVVVIGGGAVGVEMAAELKILDPQQKVTLIHSRDLLMSAEPLPDDFKDRVGSVLRESGVEVVLGQRVVDTTAVDIEGGRRMWNITLADGSKVTAGHVLSAISKCIPTTSYLPKNALDAEGYVHIHSSLQFQEKIPNAEHHFAVGDLASWPGIKRCGRAMHMGHYAANNVHQLMLQQTTGIKPEFLTLQEAPPMIGIALGKKAVTYSPVEGTRDGEDLMASMFGEDMGNTVCWNYMRLGEPCAA